MFQNMQGYVPIEVVKIQVAPAFQFAFSVHCRGHVGEDLEV